VLFEQVMRSLRWHVQELEKDAMIEERMLRGSQIALEPQPSSNDINKIMQGMMGVALSTSSSPMNVDDSSMEPLAYGREDNYHTRVFYKTSKGKGKAKAV